MFIVIADRFICQLPIAICNLKLKSKLKNLYHGVVVEIKLLSA